MICSSLNLLRFIRPSPCQGRTLLIAGGNLGAQTKWCREKVEAAERPIVISDIVYAELSVGIETKDEVDAAIQRFSFERSGYSDESLFRAGKAFLAQVRNHGRDRLLPDFLIGALADVEGEPLLTRDPHKVRTYFPDVQLIAPE